MASCLSFAKSSRCEFVSKTLRLFNCRHSSWFVVAKQSVYSVSRRSQGERLDGGDSTAYFVSSISQRVALSFSCSHMCLWHSASKQDPRHPAFQFPACNKWSFQKLPCKACTRLVELATPNRSPLQS
jgi:hypothetical protein